MGTNLQENVHESLMHLATNVMDGKYGTEDDFDREAFKEDLEEDLAFILED